MKKILLLLVIFPFFFACDKEDQQEEIIVDTSEYYVKYFVQTKSMYIGTINVTYTDENKKDKTVKISRTTNWEMVVGPVKKGFKASLEADNPNTSVNHLALSLKISVSKNGSQFSDKGINVADNYRNNASTSYTIDY